MSQAVTEKIETTDGETGGVEYVSDGTAEPAGHTPVYVVSDGEKRELDRRLDLICHSPSGFSWGYGGSGPAQLALAILADYKDDEYARKYHQGFKWRVVAEADGDEPFHVTAEDIEAALRGEP